MSGTAKILADADVVQKYYTPSLKTWLGDLGDGVHDGGPSDPRIGIIRLDAKMVTYTVSTKGMLKRATETVKGATSGEVPDIKSIRELTGAELEECRWFSCVTGGNGWLTLFRASDA